MLASMGVTGAPQVFGASAIAGFFASFFSLPFDFVKTQMQKQKPDPVTGELQYKSSIDCAMKIMVEGGPLRFYAGFPTFYVRIAPHAMLTLIAQDFTRAESYREPDATQCDKYFECNIKGEQSEHLCVDGYVYDEKSQNCDYPSKVDCGQRTELQPPQPSKNCPRANGFFAWPAEESCQKFWDCRGGQSYLQTCPQGVIFDMFVDACVTPDQSRRKECSAGEFLNFTCPTYSADEPLRFGNHDRLSDPDDCTKFYSCLRDSRPRLGVCPRKTVFNNATGVCDDPKAVPGCENFWKDKEEEEFLDYYDYS